MRYFVFCIAWARQTIRARPYGMRSFPRSAAMSEAQYLAIDLGAESGRAIIGAFDGAQLKLAELHRFPNIPVRLPDGLRWDVLRLWHEIGDAMRLAARQHGQALASIGLDTWGIDFALLDRAGVLI